MGKGVINFTYYIKENYFYMTKIVTRDTERILFATHITDKT